MRHRNPVIDAEPSMPPEMDAEPIEPGRRQGAR
jgi:hypothetical protein